MLSILLAIPRLNAIIKWLFADRFNKHKNQAELNFWRNLIAELTKDCKEFSQKEEKLMKIYYETIYPRYKRDLYLKDDSFEGKKALDIGCGPHSGLIGFTNCDKFGVAHLIEELK